MKLHLCRICRHAIKSTMEDAWISRGGLLARRLALGSFQRKAIGSPLANIPGSPWL